MSNKTDEKVMSGTQEWAVVEINCSIGCPHDCRYCYARYDQVERKALLTGEEWQHCLPLEGALEVVHPLYPGQVMFPAAHDIVPENLEACVQVLKNLVIAGNKVLVVSKPHLDCIERLCADFSEAKTQLLFRFTITARDNSILQFWEPHAPCYEDRKACLQYAFGQGFATSVSVEPMLDTADVEPMVQELLPFVSHTIWLGKMNKIDRRVSDKSREMQKEIERIENGQNDQRLLQIYRQLHKIPQLRWKESVKKVVGLPLLSKPGLDL